jgi:SAM-dependent methyltransferase
MRTPKWLYDFIYRHEINAWDIGPRKELVDFIESGRVQPCPTVYLGSGTAKNAIFMAQRGFDVTGVDYSAEAVELGRRRAQEAGVDVDFIQDDLTDLRHISGSFDFLVDFGTLDDLSEEDRALYVENVVPLAAPGSLFFLWAFEWPTRWQDRLNPFPMKLDPGEVERRFGEWFEIESLSEDLKPDLSGFEPGTATYLMTRKKGA